MCEYIYLVQEREFVKSNEDIYKIGKSKQENLKRFNSYPNGSKLLVQCICTNCNKIEKILIKLFREKYEIQRDIGNEYFKGNYIEMIKDIHENIFNFVEEEDSVCEDVVSEEVVCEKIVCEKIVCENVVCEKVCEKIVREKDIVNKVVKENIIYNCDYCEYTSNKKNNVILHTDIKHRGFKKNEKDVIENVIDLYKCDKCYNSFTRKFNLNRHQQKCKGIVNPFECQKCNKIFSSTSNKCRHYKTCKKNSTL